MPISQPPFFPLSSFHVLPPIHYFMFVSFFRQSAVTCNGGMKMASWMDLVSIPVSPGDKDDEAGLQASVQRIHALVDGLVEKGIPAERVIIGGYVSRSVSMLH